MGIAAEMSPPRRLDPAVVERLAGLGIEVGTEDRIGGLPSSPPDAATLLAATAVAAAGEGILVVADAGGDRARWRRDAADLLGPLDGAGAGAGADRPFVAIVLPADSPPRPGPVAILSPPGTASAYEVLLGAALAVAGGRRVEHLNGRGSAGSTTGGRSPGLAAARGATVDWREIAAPRPERALHELTSRPAAVVLALPPGGVDAGAVIADHPDADIVLVIDTAQRRHGAEVAAQVAAMVELAVRVETGPAGAPAPAERERAPEPAAPATGPRIRASDLVHVRLTDAAVELTNRTELPWRVVVDLGSVAEPDLVVARLEVRLEPGERRIDSTDAVAGVADLASPVAVLRHWSHGDAEVFEGGQRRMLGVALEALDERGATIGERDFEVGNGLDFAATARVLGEIVGAGTTAAPLPEPSQRPAAAAGGDLLAALQAAAATAAAVLGRRSSA